MFGETIGLRDTDYCSCPLPHFLRLILSYVSEKSHSPLSLYFKVLNASLRHDICWTICMYNKMSFITVAVYNNFLGSWIQSTDFWHEIWKWPSLEISPKNWLINLQFTLYDCTNRPTWGTVGTNATSVTCLADWREFAVVCCLYHGRQTSRIFPFTVNFSHSKGLRWSCAYWLSIFCIHS